MLSHPLLLAAGDGELVLLVCETFQAPASRNGAGGGGMGGKEV